MIRKILSFTEFLFESEDNKSYETPAKILEGVYESLGPGPSSWSSIKSKQVVDELNYLRKEGLLTDQKFTILDDKNSSVYCFNPGYSLYKSYPVITGAQKGDSLTTKSIQQFIQDNPKVIVDAFERGLKENPNAVSNLFKSVSTTPYYLTGGKFFADTSKERKIIGTVVGHINKTYFNHEFKIKQTPSGIFKRAKNVYDYLNDKFLTGIAEKTYGKRYITWETLGGKTIAYGFHGTGDPERNKRLEMTEKSLQSPDRKMSFGCINFKEPDILEIDKFIGPGQITIWLPDTTSDIVKFPPQEAVKYKGKSPLQNVLKSIQS